MPERQEEAEEKIEEQVAISRSRSRSRDDSDFSDDSSLIQSMLWKQPVTGDDGSGFVLCKGKPHVFDRWCAQPCADKRGTASFHVVGHDTVIVRRTGEARTVKCGFADLLWNEFALVLYVAVCCLTAIVRADLGKCRRRKLSTVGRVRHQVRARPHCPRRVMTFFLLYVLLSQHCLAPVQGRQLRYEKRNSPVGDVLVFVLRPTPPTREMDLSEYWNSILCCQN